MLDKSQFIVIDSPCISVTEPGTDMVARQKLERSKVF